MIRTAEFAEMADIHPKTAWLYAREGKIRSRRTGKLWKVSLKAAQEWISAKENRSGSITPDAIAKQIGCSGGYVRAQLKKNRFPFATQQPNRRWRITDCEQLREWIGSESRECSRRKKHEEQAGIRSAGHKNPFFILQKWDRWQKKIGGPDAVLKWPLWLQKTLLEELSPISILVDKLKDSHKQTSPAQR